MKDKDEKSKSKEELISRRSFFKKAAKSILPVIGGIIMTSTPLRTIAAGQSCSDCTFSCKGTCHMSCTAGCTG